MSPRPYHLGKRQEVIDEGRQRVLAAARDLLRQSTSYTGFTVEAVARRAGVARATVYYQFRSKTGLLEALCDDLALDARMAELPAVFTQPDPRQALRGFVAAFARLWAADRPVMRRLRALAALDPDVAAVISARDERRRHGIEVLAGRLTPTQGAAARAVPVLMALTSFETFDCLAGPGGEMTGAVPQVVDLAEAALGNRAGPAGSRAVRDSS